MSAGLDPESRRWLSDLRGAGAAHDHAVGRLHAMLVRAARFEVGRRRHALAHLRGERARRHRHAGRRRRADERARRLGDFRGNSRFTTWAYKFALLEAAVKLRRRAWQGREVPLEPEGWARLASAQHTPHEDAEEGEVLAALKRAIQGALTPHQREVLVALALNGVPIDVLAERLGTTRGALYKTLHDARRKLRAELGASGVAPDWLERTS